MLVGKCLDEREGAKRAQDVEEGHSHVSGLQLQYPITTSAESSRVGLQLQSRSSWDTCAICDNTSVIMSTVVAYSR